MKPTHTELAEASSLLERRDLMVATAALFCLIPLLLGWSGIWPAKSEPVPPLSGPLQFQTDINRAPLSEITLLPGIGTEMGQRIIREREQNGPFRSLEDLRRVPGIGPKTLEQLEPLVIFLLDEVPWTHSLEESSHFSPPDSTRPSRYRAMLPEAEWKIGIIPVTAPSWLASR